jgi:transposase
MISAELTAKIRRLHFAEHWKLGTIAAQLGLHRDTVERAIAIGAAGKTTKQIRPTALDPYKPLLLETLERHPTLTATRLYDMAKARGYPGGPVQVRRWVRGVRPSSRAEAFLRRVTLPGEEAQVDWGIFGKLKVGNATRTLSCFVLVLSHSRGMYAHFELDQTLESFLRGHVRAFEVLGGVPRAILYDNLKSVVLERVGDSIRFHPRLLELAGHYHFAPKPCAPYRGNEKGKVERTIRYLRDSFFAARSYSSLVDLNAQLAKWIGETAQARKVPGDPSGKLVATALAEERERLLPLPEHPFETDCVRPVASGKTPYVRFDGNDYSIPHTLVRKPLTLVASEARLRILDGSTVVATHERTYDKGRTVENEEHLADLARAKKAAHELRGRDLLRASCDHAGAFLDALSLRGGALGSQTAHLLRLLQRHGAREVNAALKEALAKGAIGAASVAHLIDQRARRRKQPPPLDVVLPDDPRVRDLHVTPHPLTDYDRLLGKDDDEPISR